MNQIIRIILASIIVFVLVLSLNGCANTVKTQTVQQRYLVVSATVAGNIDIANIRYFVFLKYNASSTTGPDLLSPNQQGHILSIQNASISLDGITSTSANLGTVSTAFDFDEFYQHSGNTLYYSGTFANIFSSYNPALIVITSPANRIQFSIPLSNPASVIGINVVTTTAIATIVSPPGVTLYNYAILDYLDSGVNSGVGAKSYHLFSNIVGNTYTGTVNSPTINPLTGLSVASSADIIYWSASII